MTSKMLFIFCGTKGTDTMQDINRFEFLCLGGCQTNRENMLNERVTEPTEFRIATLESPSNAIISVFLKLRWILQTEMVGKGVLFDGRCVFIHS
jgi:hypothetical protein